MTPEDVRNYYGSQYKFKKETGMSQGNFSYWFKMGYVPIRSQVRLHKLTKGKLRLDIDLLFNETQEEIKHGI